MKRLRSVLAGAATLLAAPLAAQTTDADPALWVVKDKDTTIYLFGTIHVLKPGLSWFDEGVKAAFDKSDELVIEMIEPDPATMQKLVMERAVDPDGPPLTQKLSAEDRADYVKAMESLGAPYQAFEAMKPWMVSVTLSLLPLTRLGYDPNSGAEKVLTEAARSAGKTVGELETAEQQLGFLDSLPEATQIAYLNATVDELPNYEKSMAEMVSSWAKGDPDRLAALMNDPVDETPELTRTLLTDRNARWAAWIDRRMKSPGTVFVAVGAGHLAGKGSVQDQLKPYRLKAKRVKY